MEKKEKPGLDRRQFLKASGAAGAVLGGCGLGLSAYEQGKDPFTYIGDESFQGAAQHFDRLGFAREEPPYEVVGPTSRPDARSEVIFYRMRRFGPQWDEAKGLDGLDPVLQQYYKAHPEDLKLDLELKKVVFPKRKQAKEAYGKRFVLAHAYSDAMSAVWPEGVHDPPEVSDFPRGEEHGEPKTPYKLKSPEKTAVLVKRIAHQLGAILVGIAGLNPDFVYSHSQGNRGFDPDEPLQIPKHWEYAIVVGTPMSWDAMYANPNFGTSFDAYGKSRIVAMRLAAFIRKLGYPARPHTPGSDYDLMVPPIAIDAGLGEQGRNTVVITPELGCNVRPAVVTTNIPVAVDKPIAFGVKEFCQTCRICAESCPSGALSTKGMETIRGYRRWGIHSSKCHNFWYSNLGPIGCRVCIADCPYTRKANWIHKTALKITANDPTGLSHAALTGLQKRFYPGPDPQDYYIPSLGGKNASYREPPWWLRAEEFIDF